MIKIGGMLESANLTLYRFSDLSDQPGMAANILKFFGENRLNLEYITETSATDGTAAMTVCVTKNNSLKVDEFFNRHPELLNSVENVKIENVSILGIYGPHFREKPAIASTFCSIIGEQSINILGLASSVSSISCIIEDNRLKEAKEALLRYFQLP